MEPGHLLPIEWAMMICFTVGVLSWGIYMKGRISDLSDSFLAGRKVPGIIASMLISLIKHEQATVIMEEPVDIPSHGRLVENTKFWAVLLIIAGISMYAFRHSHFNCFAVMKKKPEFKLNIGIPNGIILSVIGIFVLVTPLVHPMAETHVFIDIAAGLILFGGGCLSLYYGIRSMKK